MEGRGCASRGGSRAVEGGLCGRGCCVLFRFLVYFFAGLVSISLFVSVSRLCFLLYSLHCDFFCSFLCLFCLGGLLVWFYVDYYFRLPIIFCLFVSLLFGFLICILSLFRLLLSLSSLLLSLSFSFAYTYLSSVSLCFLFLFPTPFSKGVRRQFFH